MIPDQTASNVEIRCRNIGGIDETSVRLSPGVTVLKGENATNRSSLLRAIMTALGTRNTYMKSDADEATAELEVDGDVYTRQLTRRGDEIVASGDPYLDDPILADLFAFLLESNEARRAVSGNEDLRDIIMRPVDTEEVHHEIERLVQRRRELESELEEIQSLKNRLPSLEERRVQLRDEIAETKSEIEVKESELEERDSNVEALHEEKDALQDRLDELHSKRSELQSTRYDLETERESLQSLRSEKNEVASDLEALPSEPAGEIDELGSRIDRLREQKRTLESDINELQNVITFNRELLAEGGADAFQALEESTDDVTEGLLPNESITCWTCGSEVSRDQIESTVDQLQDLNRERLDEVSDVDAELEDLEDEIATLREQQRQRQELRRRRSELEDQLSESEREIETLTDRRDELEDEIRALEDEVEELEEDSHEEILALHKSINQLEYDLGQQEKELDDVESEITTIEDRIGLETDLKRRKSELSEKIEQLRTKIDDIEREAIEKFNERMDDVLQLLAYENIERIWLERVETEVRVGRGKRTENVFELHVVRQTESGATYEDSICHLSESEREVTGLVFALAGYLAHDVHETVPFMLLDSLEAIDADRIATLVGYFAEYSEFLVVTLLPEDAAALDTDFPRITSI